MQIGDFGNGKVGFGFDVRELHYEVNGPAELPDFRLWLLDQWQPGRFFSIYAAASNSRPWLELQDFDLLEPTFDRRMLSTASLWWVSTDMANLIQAAAPTLPPTTLTHELLPAPSGLVRFETPLLGIDANPALQNNVRVDAILWGSSMLGPTQSPPAKLRNKNLQGEWIGIATYTCDNGLWYPMGRTDWQFGADTDDPIDARLEDQDQTLASMAEDRRFFAAFCLLAQQKGVGEMSDVRLPRPTLRRSARRKVDAKVRLVDVRRPERPDTGGEHEERPVEWSHRWIVGGDKGGFWRQQAYGPNHSLRRPQFILPYVKGPADKPLKVKPTVRVVKGKAEGTELPGQDTSEH